MSTSERAQSDFKKLESKYSWQLSTLKELFPEWTNEDLIFTLQDADGDLELAIDRISEGHANQWGEVKTKKSKKEAAAANKATLETTAVAAPPTASYPSSSSSTNRTNKPLKQRSATSSYRSVPQQHKPQAVSWQPSKKQQQDLDSWHTQKADNGNGWNTTSTSPKKISSTPSSSTKTSNSSGAKTWASLLQSKQEPEVATKSPEVKEEDLPPLQKVDDAWLTGSTKSNLNQWDQPIAIEKKAEKSTSPALLPETQSSLPSQEVSTASEELPIDFNSLSLKDEKNASEIHPSVADLLNSVKQQTQDEQSQAKLEQPSTQQAHQAPPPQQQQQQSQPQHQQTQPQPQLQQQQQQQQQPQQLHQQQSTQPLQNMDHLQSSQMYQQQFGAQAYSSPFSTGLPNYGMYAGSDGLRPAYYDQKFAQQSNNNEKTSLNNDPSIASTNTTSATTNSALANDMYQQPYNNMQSFYPYYYMPNQFSGYQSYGQPALNRYNNTADLYGQSQPQQTQQQKPSTIANSSPYASTAYSNPLYSDFNDFGLNQTSTFASAQNTTNTTKKSPINSIQQPYASYFGQSPIFSSQGQQPYRGGNQPYWNQ